MPDDFEELDSVTLAVEVPKLAAVGVHAGAVGTVVHRCRETFDGPIAGYIVEFVDDNGRTLATADVTRDELDTV